jgi:uncharacterized membrane protein HdeD (DUF308 family)
MLALLLLVGLYELTGKGVFLDLLAIGVLIELIIRFAVSTKENMNDGKNIPY